MPGAVATPVVSPVPPALAGKANALVSMIASSREGVNRISMPNLARAPHDWIEVSASFAHRRRLTSLAGTILPMRQLPLLLALAAALAIGAWLRLDQLGSQVLIEDEWHAVHQLLYYSPKQVLLSLG